MLEKVAFFTESVEAPVIWMILGSAENHKVTRFYTSKFILYLTYLTQWCFVFLVLGFLNSAFSDLINTKWVVQSFPMIRVFTVKWLLSLDLEIKTGWKGSDLLFQSYPTTFILTLKGWWNLIHSIIFFWKRWNLFNVYLFKRRFIGSKIYATQSITNLFNFSNLGICLRVIGQSMPSSLISLSNCL